MANMRHCGFPERLTLENLLKSKSSFDQGRALFLLEGVPGFSIGAVSDRLRDPVTESRILKRSTLESFKLKHFRATCLVPGAECDDFLIFQVATKPDQRKAETMGDRCPRAAPCRAVRPPTGATPVLFDLRCSLTQLCAALARGTPS